MDDTSAWAGALEVLADETRLEILRALAEELASDPQNHALRFADLRKEVGMRDSGNFCYHLDKLTGWLVEETDDGYRLTVRGVIAISALAAGIHQENDNFGEAALDRPCPACGEPVTASHEDGTFVISCENDHAMSDFIPAKVLADRPVEEVMELVTLHVRRYINNVLSGFCALCEGPVQRAAFEMDDASPEHTFHYACERCGTPYAIPPVAAALVHPAATWFAYEHGIDLWNEPWTLFELIVGGEGAEHVNDDPPRFEVVIEMGGDELTFTVDDEPSVVDVEPSPRRNADRPQAEP